MSCETTGKAVLRLWKESILSKRISKSSHGVEKSSVPLAGTSVGVVKRLGLERPNEKRRARPTKTTRSGLSSHNRPERLYTLNLQRTRFWQEQKKKNTNLPSKSSTGSAALRRCFWKKRTTPPAPLPTAGNGGTAAAAQKSGGTRSWRSRSGFEKAPNGEGGEVDSAPGGGVSRNFDGASVSRRTGRQADEETRGRSGQGRGGEGITPAEAQQHPPYNLQPSQAYSRRWQGHLSVPTDA